MSADRLASLRAGGAMPREIFGHELGAIHRLRGLIDDHPHAELHATSYTPYRHHRVVGPNWILVGDAAAMVDPLTSNGVTSALRHSARATELVSAALDRGHLRSRDRWGYEHGPPTMVATLEAAIESFLYRPAIRRRLGLRWAVNLYAATGVITNSLYAKLRPTTAARAAACAATLAASRGWSRNASRALAALPQRAPKPAGVHPPASERLDTGEPVPEDIEVGIGG